MKKKIIAFVIVVAMSIMLLTSCNLFTLNKVRDYDQILATLSYDGMTATITKGELVEYYEQNSPIYMQYYGWTALDCVDNFMLQLAKREIMIMEAKREFATESVPKTTSDAAKFLSDDELKWVINRTNKQFKDSLASEVKKEIAADKSNIETDEDALEPRKQKEEKDEFETYRDGIMNGTDSIEKFFDEYEANKNKYTKTEQTVIEKMKKNIEEKKDNPRIHDYDFYLRQQAESRLITKYKEKVVKDVTISDEDVYNKYNLTVIQQQGKYTTDSAYKSALDGTDTVLYHRGQYVKVKSILLKFSEGQEGLYKILQAMFPNENQRDQLLAYREMLVNGDVNNPADLPFIFDNKNIGLRVNISNPDYDPDAECTDKNCTCVNCINNPINEGKSNSDIEPCKIDREQVDEHGYLIEVDGCTCVSCINNAYTKYNVPYKKVLDMINKAVYEAGVKANAEYDGKYPDMVGDPSYAISKKLYIAEARINAFVDQIYLFNDDSGMFEGKDYVGTPSGKSSDYVAEYTALIRALLEEPNATGGSMFTASDGYTVDGVEQKIYKHSTDITDDNGNVIGNETMSYIINDYGVHIVMITSIPVDKTLNSGIADAITESTETINGKTETIYTLGLDAVIGFDDIKGKAITVSDKIKESALEAKKNLTYSNFETNFFKEKYGEELFDKANESKGIKVNNDIYKQILSDLKINSTDKTT